MSDQGPQAGMGTLSKEGVMPDLQGSEAESGRGAEAAATPIANTTTTLREYVERGGGQELGLGGAYARGADTSSFLADPALRKDHMMEVQKAHTSAVRSERDFLPAGSPGARRQGDLSVQGSANIMGNDRHSYRKGPHYKATNMHHKQTNKPGQS